MDYEIKSITRHNETFEVSVWGPCGLENLMVTDGAITALDDHGDVVSIDGRDHTVSTWYGAEGDAEGCAKWATLTSAIDEEIALYVDRERQRAHDERWAGHRRKTFSRRHISRECQD